MYYTGNKKVIETGDIAEVVAHREAVDTLSDGRQMLLVGLILDPASGKSYADGEFPASIHFTDGVNHRLLSIGDIMQSFSIYLSDVGTSDEAVVAAAASVDGDDEDGAGDVGDSGDPNSDASDDDAGAGDASDDDDDADEASAK